MAASILSQDILAICLFLADGNIELSIEEVIHRAENYQKINDRHFGITRSDFHNLFHYWFIFDLGIKQLDEGIDDVKLKDVVIDILAYHSSHFNDEGEYWINEKETWDKEIYFVSIERRFGYDEKKYREKLMTKQKMKEFFEDQELTELHPESVMKFMEEIKISDKILFQCSRPGESS